MRYAGFWTRGLAMTIDSFMIVLPVNALLAIYFNGFDAFRQNDNLLLMIQLTILSLLFTLLAGSIRTPGKKAMGLRIIKIKDKTNIGYTQGFLRFVLYVLSFISIFGFLLAAFRKDKRALHDLILGTCVVYEE